MKNLLNICKQHNVKLTELTFKGNGVSQKGYAVLGEEIDVHTYAELFEIEPVHYSNGDRWKVVFNACESPNFEKVTYYKSMKEVAKFINIKLMENGERRHTGTVCTSFKLL